MNAASIQEHNLKCRGEYLANRGFTLLELAIVIIITGLLASAVFVGKDLVRASNIRNVAVQFSSYASAVANFSGKFGHLPGDMPNAVEMGLGDAGCPATGIYSGIEYFGCNGDGDAAWPTSYLYLLGVVSEATNVWFHMERAEVILNTDYTETSPAEKKTVNTSIDRVYISVGQADDRTNYLFLWRITPYEQFMIDSKVDNGKPNGVLRNAEDARLVADWVYDPDTGTWIFIDSSADCVIGDEYNIQNDSLTDCILAHRILR